MKTMDILPIKMIMVFIALFSTTFMIICKLTGDGHFGIECIGQVRVISVDNSIDVKPYIYQDGKEINIDILNDKDECLLPFCSCIHPSILRWNSLKYPELYERCFYDQCKNPDNICLNKPNNSKCMMRNKMCLDINDWCGIPSWIPTDYPPAKLGHGESRVIKYDGKSYQIDTAEITYVKYEYEVNCDNGRICCRYLLGSDVSKEYYYNEKDLEWLLKVRCASLHQHSMTTRNRFRLKPMERVAWIQMSRYIAPVYSYRMDLDNAISYPFQQSWNQMDYKTFTQICENNRVSKICNQAIEHYGDQGWLYLINEIDVNHQFMKDMTASFLNYYDEHNLCLKVLFTAK